MDYRVYEAIIELMVAVKQKYPDVASDSIQCFIHFLLRQVAEDINAGDNETVEYVDYILTAIQQHIATNQN